MVVMVKPEEKTLERPAAGQTVTSPQVPFLVVQPRPAMVVGHVVFESSLHKLAMYFFSNAIA